MLKFTSTADLLRLQQTDPAQPVITELVHGLINNDPVTIALMESHDLDHPLAELCNAEDVSLEGIVQQQGMYLIVLQTNYGYGIVFVVPNAGWLGGELRRCIEQNLQQLPTTLQ